MGVRYRLQDFATPLLAHARTSNCKHLLPISWRLYPHVVDGLTHPCSPPLSQERWEAEQAKRTRRGGGNAEVLAEAAARDAEKYELLFDDQIEYIKVC